MTTQPRHLVAVPDDVGAVVQAALLEIVEEVAALQIHDGTHLWNVATDEIIDLNVATEQDRAEAIAAEDRMLKRIAAGDPVPDNVQRMRSALARALAREDDHL